MSLTKKDIIVDQVGTEPRTDMILLSCLVELREEILTEIGNLGRGNADYETALHDVTNIILRIIPTEVLR